MEGILSEVPGVASATVDFDSKTATIECAEGASRDDVSQAVTEAMAKSGQYTAHPKN